MTTGVKERTILLCYLGVIKPHYEVKADNDDIYSLGIVNTSDNTCLLIDPSQVGNAGRYVNTAYGKHINCRAELGMFTPSNGHPEPAIILVSTKSIKAGD